MWIEPAGGGLVPGLKAEVDAEFYANGPRSMLDTLAHNRILMVEKVTMCAVRLTEGCDDYFSVELTKAEFSQLISELGALRDTLQG